MLQLQHNDYKVGWICALPKEQTAAIAMLDVRHANLPKPPTDPNAYTLGSIGDHNIVIACLPKGQYGTVSASVVATNMASTFPAIRFGLMVGIGGGIPPKVRLGDVVVSVPVDQFPGVVQWDMGKAEEGGTFRRTGALNNPPTLLLTALTQLESDHEMIGPGFPQFLEELATKFPRLASKYAKSNHLQDILFDKDYPHASCIDGAGQDHSCSSCDQSRSVKREPRDVQVHYGLIASGDRVIKDAKFRESLVKELGGYALCVEMEAAGLVNNFPCIVIRGICDYADSHKNKVWQEHAAAVAAAFAKELLGYVTADEIAQEKAAQDILSQIDHSVKAIMEDTMDTRLILNKKEDEDILTWLSKTHYGAQQSDYLRLWHSKTGRWFLGSKEYQDWLDVKGTKLYCSGIPGAGKTIMAAAIINNISYRISSDKSIGLAYIYFTFSQQREQTTEHVLASLLMQILSRRPSLPQHIHDLYKKHKMNGTRPDRRELLNNLKTVLSDYTRAYIVLDALDECGTSRPEVLQDLSELHTEASANVLVTSRLHEGIAAQFCQKGTLRLSINAPKTDIKFVLRDRMKAHDQELFNPSFREQVAYEISAVAKGMFLLARLHLDAVIVMPTRGRIKRALKELALQQVELYDVYEQAMERIASQGRETNGLAKEILSWIVHARSPLSTAQLQYTLSVTPDSKDIDEDDIPSIKTLESVCAGLVTIDTASNTVRLIHYTTQEYFERTQERWFPNAQRHITQICVQCLSFPVSGELADSFYDYAACEWGHHARASPAMSEVLDFLQKPKQIRQAMRRLKALRWWRIRWEGTDMLGYSYSMLALHVAVHFGLVYAVQGLLCNYNAVDDHNQNPTVMAHAITVGRLAVVEAMLGVKGMDINHKDSQLMTPLGLAVKKRDTEIARLLLATGRVEVNSRDQAGQTPLFRAIESYQAEMAELLLDTKGVDLNSKNHAGQTPLMSAISRRLTKVIDRLLHNQGVKFDTEANQSSVAIAAEMGYDKGAEIMLKTNLFDINRKDPAGQTALALAIRKHRTAVVELLLNLKGINVNCEDRIGQTPLATAANLGYEAVIRMLLATGKVDINRRDQFCQTALALASARGHTAVVQLLLKTGRVDTSSNYQTGQTPLELAATNGHAEVAKMLLITNRIDPNSKDRLGHAALASAAAHGHDQVVQVLAEIMKVDSKRRNVFGRTSLVTTASIGNEHVFQVLVKADIFCVDSKHFNGLTPSARVAEYDDLEVVQSMMDNCRDHWDFDNDAGSTLMAHEGRTGHLEVVMMLFKSGRVDLIVSDVNDTTGLLRGTKQNFEAVADHIVSSIFDFAWDDGRKFVVFDGEMDLGGLVLGSDHE